jgi:segregation and condensation protein B
MDYFGINTKEDLPKISEVLMEELVQATVINHSNEVEEIEGVSALVVDEDGKIVEEVDEVEQSGDENSYSSELTKDKQVKEDETTDES